MNESGWYLVRTKPMSEYVAASGLESNGYKLYFPRVETPSPRVGRGDAPLFPGYIFVRRGDEDGGRVPVHLISGLLGWVQFDGVAPRVEEEEIEELERRLELMNRGGGEWRRYRVGERVRVVTGSVESLAEVLEEPGSPESRVRVLLEFMNESVPARVPWESLEPVREDTAGYNGERRPRRTRGRGRWVSGFGPRAVE